MLTAHQSTKRNSYFSRAMVLPLLLVLLSAFALRPVHSLHPVLHPAGRPVSVVIDAGHGGIDPGAQADNLREKDIALTLAQKVNELASQYNVRVIMTRNSDELPGGLTNIRDGLRERVFITEREKAEMFISLHMNMSDKTALHPQRGFEAYISTGKANNKSALLATTLLHQLETLYTIAPEIKQRPEKRIWVLEQNPTPSVLIECGNIGVAEDRAFITNKDNQEKIARGILEGIVKFSGS